MMGTNTFHEMSSSGQPQVPSTRNPNEANEQIMDGRMVQLRKFNRSDYEKKEILCYIDQIDDCQFPLRDINPRNIDELNTSFEEKQFDYTYGMISVTFDPEKDEQHKQVFSDFEHAFETKVDQDIQVLKKPYHVSLIDGRHRKKIILQCKSKGKQWSKQLLRVNLIVRKDNRPLLASEIIKLGSISNFSSSNVRNNTSFVEYMKIIINYGKSFSCEHNIPFKNARIVDIVNDMISSKFLGDLSKSSYERYTRVARFLLKKPQIFNLLVEYDKQFDKDKEHKNPVSTEVNNSNDNKGGNKTMGKKNVRDKREKIGICHLDNPIFYKANITQATLYLKALYAHLAYGFREGPFPAKEFYLMLVHGFFSLIEAYNIYVQRRTSSVRLLQSDVSITFEDFLKIRIQNYTTTISIDALFAQYMCPFSNDPTEDIPRTNAMKRAILIWINAAYPNHAIQRGQINSNQYFTANYQNTSGSQDGNTAVVGNSTQGSQNANTQFNTSCNRNNSNHDLNQSFSKANTANSKFLASVLLSNVRNESSSIRKRPRTTFQMNSTSESCLPMHDPRNNINSVRAATTENINEATTYVHTIDPASLGKRSLSISYNSAHAARRTTKGRKLSGKILPDTDSDRGHKRKFKSMETENSRQLQLEPTIGNFQDNISRSPPIGYTEYPCIIDDVGSTWIRNSRLPYDFRNVELDYKYTSVRPLLKSALIPTWHRANVYFNLEEVRFLRSLAWLWATASELERIGVSLRGSSDIFASESHLNEGYGVAYFNARKVELDERGYTNLKGFADPCRGVTKEALALLGCPESFPKERVQDLFDYISSTFPGEESLKKRKSRVHWNPIINTANESLDKMHRDDGKARYCSTPKLMDHIEKDENLVWASRLRAMLDVWVGWLSALMHLDKKGAAYLPVSGGRFLISGKGIETQAGHNDFPVDRSNPEKNPGYFVIVTGSEPSNLYVSDNSHKFVFSSQETLAILARALKMRKIQIPSYSIFVGHGHLQHAGDKHRGSRKLRYHIYVVPDQSIQSDAIGFAYGTSIPTELSDAEN